MNVKIYANVELEELETTLEKISKIESKFECDCEVEISVQEPLNLKLAKGHALILDNELPKFLAEDSLQRKYTSGESIEDYKKTPQDVRDQEELCIRKGKYPIEGIRLKPYPN